jgi:hypothetical protein
MDPFGIPWLAALKVSGFHYSAARCRQGPALMPKYRVEGNGQFEIDGGWIEADARRHPLNGAKRS